MPKATPWPATPRRKTGRWLMRQRKALFDREPLCRLCAAKGKVAVATERDHIIPLHKGGADRPDNIQPLCSPCHEAKTRSDCGYRDRPAIGLDGWPVEGASESLETGQRETGGGHEKTCKVGISR